MWLWPCSDGLLFMNALTGPGAAGTIFGRTKALGGGAGVVKPLLRLLTELAEEPRRSNGLRAVPVVVEEDEPSECKGEDGTVNVTRDGVGIRIRDEDVAESKEPLGAGVSERRLRTRSLVSSDSTAFQDIKSTHDSASLECRSCYPHSTVSS